MQYGACSNLNQLINGRFNGIRYKTIKVKAKRNNHKYNTARDHSKCDTNYCHLYWYVCH